MPKVELDPGAGPAVAGGGGVPVVTCPVRRAAGDAQREHQNRRRR